MKNIELLSMIKTPDGYNITTRDIYTGLTGSCNLAVTSKRRVLECLRRWGIVCPHRAYRNS